MVPFCLLSEEDEVGVAGVTLLVSETVGEGEREGGWEGVKERGREGRKEGGREGGRG